MWERLEKRSEPSLTPRRGAHPHSLGHFNATTTAQRRRTEKGMREGSDDDLLKQQQQMTLCVCYLVFRHWIGGVKLQGTEHLEGEELGMDSSRKKLEDNQHNGGRGGGRRQSALL
ncbi:hypothetical protein niasHT_022206 [Heterodera trifolii]|uniref:Uncharacterized protein n=1 Tax=Heterodera trifolii TaxID=157864 RepID=A0ABD2KSW2_9BILA